MGVVEYTPTAVPTAALDMSGQESQPTKFLFAPWVLFIHSLRVDLVKETLKRFWNSVIALFACQVGVRCP